MPVSRLPTTSPEAESFIGLMNAYAKRLGLTNTTFQTVHGLDAPGSSVPLAIWRCSARP